MKAGRDEVRRSDQRRHDGNFSLTARRVASIVDLFGRPIVWTTKRIEDRLESLGLIRRGICIRFATLASIQLAAIKTNDCATYPSAPPCISPRALYSSVSLIRDNQAVVVNKR